jgi:hypothetical protein
VLVTSIELEVEGVDGDIVHLVSGGEMLEARDVPDEMAPFVEPMFDIDVQGKVDIDVSGRQRPVVTNVDEVLAAMAPMGTALRETLAGRGLPAEIIERAVAEVMTPQMAAQGVVESLIPLVSYTCKPLALGDTTFRGELPHPLGGTLPVDGVLSVSRLGDHTIAVRSVETHDVDAVREAVRGIMERQLPEGATAADRRALAAEIAAVDLHSQATVEVQIDAHTGWVTAYQTQHVVEFPGQPTSRESREVVTEPRPTP